MATAIENVSIASAKERAASILYGNEKMIEDNQYEKPSNPVIAKYSVPIREESKPKTGFNGYYTVDAPKPKPVIGLRTYQTPNEVVMNSEPKVFHPFVDATAILSNKERIESAPVAMTSVKVESQSICDIEDDIDEDTQYVVKFKTSTIVIGIALSVIFFLMAVLFVVNAVSLATNSATLDRLQREQEVINKQLNEIEQETDAIRQEIINEVESNLSNYNDLPISRISKEDIIPYQPETVESGGFSFFDWVCKFMSGIFG